MVDPAAFTVETTARLEMVDISRQVQDHISASGVDSGIVLVYTPHTTAGITINEDADPAVRRDMIRFLSEMVPQDSRFEHSEGNSPAHIMSSLVSASETLIISGGELLLGTWQGIFFCEFDGPRKRTVRLKILPG